MASKPEEEGFRWLEIDLSDMGFLIKKHFWLLVLVPSLGGVLMLGITLLMRPVFSSTASIYLRPNFDKEMQLERGYSKLEDADSIRSIERGLVSDTVILATVDRLGLRNDAGFFGEEIDPGGFTDAKLLKIVRDRYNTKLIPNTRTVELIVEDYSAERTAELADTIIDEFLKHLRTDRNEKEADLRATLITQSGKALEHALDSERKLKRFRSENPETLVEQDSSVFQDRVLQNGVALNEANSERSRIVGTLKALEEIDPDREPYRVFQILSNRNSEYLSDLLSMHSSAKASMAAVRDRFAEQHPDFQSAKSRLDDIDLTLRNYAREMKNGVESEYEAASRRVEELGENLAVLRGDFVGFKTASAEFRGVKEEIDRNWNTYTSLQQKIMDLDLDPEVTPTFATVMSHPVVPDKKSKPRRLIWTAAGIFLGGLFSVGLIYFRNRGGLPFTSKEQLTELHPIPVVAEIEVPATEKIGDKLDGITDAPGVSNLLITLGDTKLIQVGAIEQTPGADLFPLPLGRACGNRGMRTLLISISDGGDENAEIRPSGYPNLEIIRASKDILWRADVFRDGLFNLSNQYDRIIVDTLAIEERGALISVGRMVQASVLTVGRGGSEPRAAYTQFVEQCAVSGVAPIAMVYLDGKGLGKGTSPSYSLKHFGGRRATHAPNRGRAKPPEGSPLIKAA